MFENAKFLNESFYDLNINIVNENDSLIKNCDFIIDDYVIKECFGDRGTIRHCVLYEAAKMDITISNFCKGGKDYKGLKADLKEIIEANNLVDSALKSKSKSLIKVCKRIIQIILDIEATLDKNVTPWAAAFLAAFPGMSIARFIVMIISIITKFILNRLLRLLVDTGEFKSVKSDAETIISMLREKAKTTDNKSIAANCESDANKLEASIKKYSENKD